MWHNRREIPTSNSFVYNLVNNPCCIFCLDILFPTNESLLWKDVASHASFIQISYSKKKGQKLSHNAVPVLRMPRQGVYRLNFVYCTSQVAAREIDLLPRSCTNTRHTTAAEWMDLRTLRMFYLIREFGNSVDYMDYTECYPEYTMVPRDFRWS